MLLEVRLLVQVLHVGTIHPTPSSSLRRTLSVPVNTPAQILTHRLADGIGVSAQIERYMVLEAVLTDEP